MAVRIALLVTLLVNGHAEIAHPMRANFTPDGRYVLIVSAWTGDAAGDQPEFRVWDFHAGEFIAEHRFDGRDIIEGLDIAPDTETLVVATISPGRRERYNMTTSRSLRNSKGAYSCPLNSGLACRPCRTDIT